MQLFLVRTKGNSCSPGRAPPSPGLPHGSKSASSKHESKDHSTPSKSGKETKKSGLSGGSIAAAVISMLVTAVLLLVIFSQKSLSPRSSHFLEEKLKHRRPFTPLSSHDLQGIYFSFFLHLYTEKYLFFDDSERPFTPLVFHELTVL